MKTTITLEEFDAAALKLVGVCVKGGIPDDCVKTNTIAVNLLRKILFNDTE